MTNRARLGQCLMVPAVVLLTVAACGGSSSPSGGGNTPTPTPAATTPAGPTQTMTITPHKGLHDGQKVTVVGKGFTAGKTYGVTECADKGAATGAGDCNLGGIKGGVADATGTVTVTFPVAKGPFGANHIVCTKPPGCIVSVATAGSAAPDEVAAAKIKFA
jgi:neocarzinostatin family protein